MQLKQDQINKFRELHQDIEGFQHFSDAKIEEIANGVANYYLVLFKIQQRIKNENRHIVPDSYDVL